MDYNKFYELFYQTNNIIIYGIILTILITLFYKNIICVFDPIWITLISQGSIITVILILIKAHKINMIIGFNLLILSISFLIGLKYFLSTNKKINLSFKVSKINFKIFFSLHTFFFLIVCIFYLKKIGLAGFRDKFTIFQNLGLLRYFINVIIPGEIILILLKRDLYNQKSKKDGVFILMALIMSILQGGKTNIVFSIMTIAMTIFMISKACGNQKFKEYKKKEKYFLIISLFIVFIAFRYTMETASISQTFKAIIFRMISEADTIYLYYPNKLEYLMKDLNIINYYLNSLIRPIYTRIIGDLQDTAIGFKIIQEIYNIENPIFGPNTRAEIVWQQNLGFLGIFFSIGSAYIYSKFRNCCTLNYIQIYLYVLGIINIDLILRDFPLFIVNYILGVIFCFVPIFCVSKFLFQILKKNNEEKGG